MTNVTGLQQKDLDSLKLSNNEFELILKYDQTENTYYMYCVILDERIPESNRTEIPIRTQRFSIKQYKDIRRAIAWGAEHGFKAVKLNQIYKKV